MGLVWAMGHTHQGGLGLELWAYAPHSQHGELLCHSAPRVGMGGLAKGRDAPDASAPGNELGYVVGMGACTNRVCSPSPPPFLLGALRCASCRCHPKP